jgi:hypothetical protein
LRPLRDGRTGRDALTASSGAGGVGEVTLCGGSQETFNPTRRIFTRISQSFVAKQQAPCDPTDPADDHDGDWWDRGA